MSMAIVLQNLKKSVQSVKFLVKRIIKVIPSDGSLEIWERAEKLHSFGWLGEAKNEYRKLINRDPYSALAQIRMTNLNAEPFQPFPSDEVDLVWQTGIHPAGSVVRLLFQNVRFRKEIDDSDPLKEGQHKYTYQSKYMVVVDHVIRSSESVRYYQECRASGCHIVLIHLADEHLSDTLAIYECCQTVFRNYWSPFLAMRKNVHFFPLGDNSSQDFPEIPTNIKASSRDFAWNFLGDPQKADRKHAIDSFRGITPNRIHLVAGFFDPKKLGPFEYRKILSQSVFTLCPDGNVNVDTFRFWEAMEFGSIPIVVNRKGFDYFESLLQGPLPFPTFTDWEAAARFTADLLKDPHTLDHLQHEMISWWQCFKSTLAPFFAEKMGSVTH